MYFQDPINRGCWSILEDIRETIVAIGSITASADGVIDESNAEIEGIGRCFAHIENIKRQSLNYVIDNKSQPLM